MQAQKVDNNISSGVINVENIQEYYSPSQIAINNLDNYDFPRLERIYNKRMRVFSNSQPTDPENGMAWFKIFN